MQGERGWVSLRHKLHALTTKMLDSNPWSGKKGLAPSYASWGQLKWQNLVAEAYYSVCHGKPQKKNPQKKKKKEKKKIF